MVTYDDYESVFRGFGDSEAKVEGRESIFVVVGLPYGKIIV